VRRFDTIEELRLALHAFKNSCNRTWIVERHGYQTPAAVSGAARGAPGSGMNLQRGVSQLLTATTPSDRASSPTDFSPSAS
jgi:hypothetical protein